MERHWHGRYLEVVSGFEEKEEQDCVPKLPTALYWSLVGMKGTRSTVTWTLGTDTTRLLISEGRLGSVRLRSVSFSFFVAILVGNFCL
jgi:hypothetical protein